MIASFRSKTLKRLWEKSDPHGLNPQHIVKIEQLLTALEQAMLPEDMNSAGFDFHKLTGERPNRWSVQVNGNWCVTFAFDAGDALAVDYEEYY